MLFYTRQVFGNLSGVKKHKFKIKKRQIKFWQNLESGWLKNWKGKSMNIYYFAKIRFIFILCKFLTK